MNLILADKPEWQERALCAQTDPEAYFPEKGGSIREAKRICNRCEVKAECLDYALGHNERFGIWGGLSERERRRLKRGQPIGTSHQGDAAAAAMVERIAELSVQGLTDRQIGVVLGWKADRVYRFRSRHGIDGGRKYRQRGSELAPVGAVA